MSTQPAGKEQWGSKLGVILAVSGSAVGLGNFLRFPGQAAAYGGGAFLIPYFVALLIVGIPICWVEWTLGRQGGRAGFNSSPGILYHLIRHPVARVFGTLGLLIPVAIYMYYVYIEAWCLGYAYDYLMGRMPHGADASIFKEHFTTFVGSDANGLGARANWFLLVAFVLNFILIYRGLTKGIEAFCKVAMPTLIVAAIVVLVRVLTLPPQPVAEPWQMSLPQVLSSEQWTSLGTELNRLEQQAEQTRQQVEQQRTSMAVEDEDANALLDAQLAGAEGAVLEAIRRVMNERQAATSTAGDASSTVPIEVPAGYLASYPALKITLAVLRSATTTEAYAKWIRQGRESLDDDVKWEFIRLETAQERLAADLAGDHEAKRAAAEEKLARYRVLRADLLAQTPSLPTIAGQDETEVKRHAAASVAAVERTVMNGLGFMWNPKPTEPGGSTFSALADPDVWFAAAAQIFFSISVGFGIIITYASYLRRNDDVVLSGLTATSTNEFCEVCLGGLITIPAAFIFLGAMPLAGVPSTLALGFATLPAVFEAMPAGRFFGFLWFSMLFAAAITSSLSMLQPAIAFLEEGFGLKRKASVAILGMITAMGCLLVVYFSKDLKALDAIDFWIGSFCVFVMATVLIIVFGWIIGVDKGLAMAAEGAELRIPRFFAFVFKYVSPLYLLIIFGFWLYAYAGDRARSVLEDEVELLTIVFLFIVAVFFGVLVSLATRRWDRQAAAAASTDPLGETG